MSYRLSDGYLALDVPYSYVSGAPASSASPQQRHQVRTSPGTHSVLGKGLIAMGKMLLV